MQWELLTSDEFSAAVRETGVCLIALGVVALVGFALFVAWELTEKHPVVDLTLFAGRNFLFGVIAIATGYVAAEPEYDYLGWGEHGPLFCYLLQWRLPVMIYLKFIAGLKASALNGPTICIGRTERQGVY